MANEAKTAQPGHQQALVGIGRDKDVSLDNKERKINLEQKAPAYLIKTSRHHESSVIGSGGIQLNISGRRNSAEVEKSPQSGHSVALSLFESLLVTLLQLFYIHKKKQNLALRSFSLTTRKLVR